MPPKSPRSWPNNVTFIDRPVYSPKLDAECRKLLNNVSNAQETLPSERGPSANVRITPIDEKDHPAFGQKGLFAARHLAPSTFIISYIGYVHDENDMDPTSDYDISLDRELKVAVDATKMGNEARFINDFRGLERMGSTSPNAEFKDVWIRDSQGHVEKRIGVFVLSAGKAGKRSKGIAKGKEILVSYGKGFWNVREQENVTKEVANDV